jgi:acyl-CoA thioesterase
MAKYQNIEEAREYFKNDRFATDNGMIIEEITDEYVVTGMEISERHQNAYGGLMGGAIFTLADFAFAVASNDRENRTVAMQVSINFLSAPKGSRLKATARCKKDGRTTTVYVVDVTDETGRDIAQFVGTGYKL